MANVHVLDQDGHNNYRLALHILIPNVNNQAGINLRTVVVNSKLGGTTILPDGDGTGGSISAAEKTSIQSGALLERVVTDDITVGGTLSGNAILTHLDQVFADQQTVVQAEITAKLSQFGRTR